MGFAIPDKVVFYTIDLFRHTLRIRDPCRLYGVRTSTVGVGLAICLALGRVYSLRTQLCVLAARTESATRMLMDGNYSESVFSRTA